MKRIFLYTLILTLSFTTLASSQVVTHYWPDRSVVLRTADEQPEILVKSVEEFIMGLSITTTQKQNAFKAIYSKMFPNLPSDLNSDAASQTWEKVRTILDQSGFDSEYTKNQDGTISLVITRKQSEELVGK